MFRSVQECNTLVNISSMKLDIENFDRSVNFGLWQVKMKAILIHNGVHKALEGEDKKPIGVSEAK